MTWVKSDDNYPHHPKMIEAGVEGYVLDHAGTCYASRHHTDGFVLDGMLGGLFPPLSNPRKVADRLVAVGRWERDDKRGGWWIHDFLVYNPSAEEAAARSAQASAAAQTRHANRNANRTPSAMRSASEPHSDEQAHRNANGMRTADKAQSDQQRVSPARTRDARAAARARPEPDLGDSYISSSTHVGGGERRDDDDSASQPQPAATVVEAALERIARDDLERRKAEHGPVGDEPKWLDAALVRRRDSLRALGAALLDETPTLSVTALADQLVPKVPPKAGPTSVVEGTQRAARQREAAADAVLEAEREAAANGAVVTGEDAKARLAAAREALG